MGLSEISALSSLPSATRSESSNAQEIAREFDTMIWELMLRETGLFKAFAPEGGNEGAVLGEFFLQDFARQLAAQVDIGFGRMALAGISAEHTRG